MDFPAEGARPADAPTELRDGLGIPTGYVGKNRMDYLVEVESESVVRALQPDFRLLGALPVRGIIVTARSASPDYDFVSRFFGPAAGVDEDPVTGSAHCCLAPHWSAKLGKAALVGYQASARGGVVRTRLAGDRVLLGGRAVTVLVGDLL